MNRSSRDGRDGADGLVSNAQERSRHSEAQAGKNSELGLPRDAMRRVVVAIDVDGTLRCNHTDTCEDPNPRIVEMAKTLATFKNVKVMVWSGGGKAYAQRFMDKYGMGPKVKAASKLDPSTWLYGRPQIAIDDIQDTAIADLNLIVREK